MCRINGVVVTWVVAIDPPGVRFPLNASMRRKSFSFLLYVSRELAVYSRSYSTRFAFVEYDLCTYRPEIVRSDVMDARKQNDEHPNSL